LQDKWDAGAAESLRYLELAITSDSRIYRLSPDSVKREMKKDFEVRRAEKMSFDRLIIDDWIE
jgi:hypothetical protein